jgi:hypothetical protein
MPAKAGIQTWPRVPGLWIPVFAGMTQKLKDLLLNDAPDSFRPMRRNSYEQVTRGTDKVVAPRLETRFAGTTW